MTHSLTATVLAAAAAMTIAGATVRATVRATEPTPVEAALSVSGALPDASRRALVQEVESIWRRAGVEIGWVEEPPTAVGSRSLRILIVDRTGTPRPGHDWVAGELLRFDDGGAVAVASIARAAEIVRTAGDSRSRGIPESLAHHRLGLVLGRAVAHEIGHYLLPNPSHATHGLMRSTFRPRELTDLRSGTFEVDAASRRRLHHRLAAAPAVAHHESSTTPVDVRGASVE